MELNGVQEATGLVATFFTWVALLEIAGARLFLILMAMSLRELKLVKLFVAMNQRAKVSPGIRTMLRMALAVCEPIQIRSQ